jgi:hypothetical protein
MFFAVTAVARLMEAGLALADVSLKASEMTAAAGTVIGARGALMAAAAQDPLSADYAELGRMIPEKMEAFSAAGAALVEEAWALQRDIGDYLLYIGRAMTSGRPPLPSELAELMERSSAHGVRLAASAIGAASVALSSVHKSATANARRLSRPKPRKRRSP